VPVESPSSGGILARPEETSHGDAVAAARPAAAAPPSIGSTSSSYARLKTSMRGSQGCSK
jgi:hypothetical protein